MAYDSEKQMLRELANWVLPQLNCHFCHEPMLEEKAGERQGFGHRRHTSVRELITFHHLDEDREHNKITNVVICHPVCHKRSHKKKKENTIANTTADSGSNQGSCVAEAPEILARMFEHHKDCSA